MLTLNSEIKIGDYWFYFCTNIQIKRSWEEITDTAIIEFPNFIKNIKERYVIANIKRNDPVDIKLGYIYKDGGQIKNSLLSLFKGYVTTVKNGDVLTVKCEDNMFKLKQYTVQKYTKSGAVLGDFIKDILDYCKLDINYRVLAPETHIGNWKISNSNVVQVLYELRKFGLFARFEGDLLIIDTPYDITLTNDEKDARTKYFGFQSNIIDSNLDYRNSEDIDLTVRGVSILEDNTKIELYTYIDSTGRIITTEAKREAEKGNQVTWTTYNQTKAQLQKTLEKKIKELNYSGYYGSFKTFGIPVVYPGYFIYLIDKKYPERNKDARYVVKSVGIDFGDNGYRQNIKIGMRA